MVVAFPPETGTTTGAVPAPVVSLNVTLPAGEPIEAETSAVRTTLRDPGLRSATRRVAVAVGSTVQVDDADDVIHAWTSVGTKTAR